MRCPPCHPSWPLLRGPPWPASAQSGTRQPPAAGRGPPWRRRSRSGEGEEGHVLLGVFTHQSGRAVDHRVSPVPPIAWLDSKRVWPHRPSLPGCADKVSTIHEHYCLDAQAEVWHAAPHHEHVAPPDVTRTSSWSAPQVLACMGEQGSGVGRGRGGGVCRWRGLMPGVGRGARHACPGLHACSVPTHAPMHPCTHTENATQRPEPHWLLGPSRHSLSHKSRDHLTSRQQQGDMAPHPGHPGTPSCQAPRPPIQQAAHPPPCPPPCPLPHCPTSLHGPPRHGP
jgi:hypothetical protein